MSDDLDHLPDRKAQERLSEAKHRLAVRRQRERWAREGHDPAAHLQAVTAEGDKDVLIGFGRLEYAGRGPQNLATFTAAHGIYELLNAIRRAELRQGQEGVLG